MLKNKSCKKSIFFSSINNNQSLPISSCSPWIWAVCVFMLLLLASSLCLFIYKFWWQKNRNEPPWRHWETPKRSMLCCCSFTPGFPQRWAAFIRTSWKRAANYCMSVLFFSSRMMDGNLIKWLADCLHLYGSVCTCDFSVKHNDSAHYRESNIRHD